MISSLGRDVENRMQRSDFARWAEHGFAKLSKGPDAFAGILQQLGLPLPRLQHG
jgi:hypothetical protein